MPPNLTTEKDQRVLFSGRRDDSRLGVVCLRDRGLEPDGPPFFYVADTVFSVDYSCRRPDSINVTPRERRASGCRAEVMIVSQGFCFSPLFGSR